MSHQTHHDSSRQSPEQIENDIAQTRMEMGRTLDHIQRKLSPGQMVDEGIAYLRNSGAGDFTSNFGVTVKNNPMPVALLSVGVAWLMMTTRNPQSQYPTAAYAAPDPSDIGWPEDSGPSRRERIGRAISSFGDQAGDAGHRVAEAAHNIGHQVADAASNVGGRVSQFAAGARDGASQLTDGGTRFAAVARGSIAQAGDIARTQYDRARSSAQHIAEEQPLVLGALGVTLGAVLGALLPASRREDELMGSTRDDLVQSGIKQYEGAKDTIKEVARKTQQELAADTDTGSAASV